MTSGLTAFPTFGADRKPAPRFSAAVIRYLVALPVLTPAGILITQRKTRVELFQPHALSAGFLIPGPVRDTWTRCAAASERAILLAMGWPAGLVSWNRTVTVPADFATVLPARGAMKPPNPYSTL